MLLINVVFVFNKEKWEEKWKVMKQKDEMS